MRYQTYGLKIRLIDTIFGEGIDGLCYEYTWDAVGMVPCEDAWEGTFVADILDKFAQGIYEESVCTNVTMATNNHTLSTHFLITNDPKPKSIEGFEDWQESHPLSQHNDKEEASAAISILKFLRDCKVT